MHASPPASGPDVNLTAGSPAPERVARRRLVRRIGPLAAVVVSLVLHLALFAAVFWRPEEPETDPVAVTLVPVELVVAPPPSPSPSEPAELRGLALPVVPVLPMTDAPLALDGIGAGAPGPLAEEAAAGDAPGGTPDGADAGEPAPETDERAEAETAEAEGSAQGEAAADAAETDEADSARDGSPGVPAPAERPAVPEERPATPAGPGDGEAETAAEEAAPPQPEPLATSEAGELPAVPETDETAEETVSGDAPHEDVAEASADAPPLEGPDGDEATDAAADAPPADAPAVGTPAASGAAPAPLWDRLGSALRESAGSATEGGGAEADYAEAVRSAIAPGFYAAMASVRASGTVVVEVVIQRDGTVRSARVVQSSGDPALDAGSLSAARSARYPPLPGGRDALTVHIPLRVR